MVCLLRIYWWYFCRVVVVKHSATGVMASSSCGASCAKPSKDVFRTQPYIQDGAFMKIVNAEVFSQKSSILDVWLEPKYASALCSQKSVRVQLLNKLSEILHKFVRNSERICYFTYQKSNFLKAASYSNSNWNFKLLQRRRFLEKFVYF